MGYYHEYGFGQFFFDRTLYAFRLVLKYLLRSIIYLPLLLTGYLVTSAILNKTDSAVAWVGLILLFTYSCYLLLYFLKGIILALKKCGNLLWIPLLTICLLFTCVLPSWMLFDTVHNFMERISIESAGTLTWIFSFSLGIYIYSRYHFLTDMAPLAVFPVYKMGIELTFKTLHISPLLAGTKAKQLI